MFGNVLGIDFYLILEDSVLIEEFENVMFWRR